MISHHTINGLSYLNKEGDSPPVILLHGISSWGESFRALMNETRLETYAFDLPGYGQSQAINEKSVANDFALLFLKTLAELKIEKAILLGSSLGCLIATRMALLKPELFSHLVLVGAALGYDTENYPPSVTSRLEEIAASPDDYALKRASRLIENANSKPKILTAVQSAMRAMRLEGLKATSHTLSTGNLLKDATQMKVPTHVLVGEGDVIAPPDNALKLVQALGLNCRSYQLMQGAGHALVQEQPQKLARILENLS